MRRITTLLLLWGSLLVASAQFVSHMLPLDNVMNSYQTRCVCQDEHGYIWIGTGSGFYRYDGYQYQKIQSLQHPELLPNEAVLQINNWGNRYLWLRLRGSVYGCYDVENDAFVDWNGDKPNDESYTRFVIVDEHHLWLYDKNRGALHVSQQDGVFNSTVYQKENGHLPSNQISFICQEKNGRVWIGTDQGLVRIQQGKSHVFLRNKSIAAAQPMSDGTVIFVTEYGEVYRTHPSGSMGVFIPPTPLPHKVKRVAMEHDELILCTDGPTYCCDTRRRTLTLHPRISIENAQMVEDNLGNKVVFDRDGYDLWYITPKQTYHLTDIYNKEMTRENDGGRFIFVYDRQDRIWISTNGNGLFVYDTHSGSMKHITKDDKPVSLISSDHLQNIIEDRNGCIWVCQENFGICCISSQQQPLNVLYFTSSEDMGHGNTIRLIMPVGDKVYIGNRQKGLWVTDAQLENRRADTTYDNDVVAMAQDRQGRLWTGTRSKGIFVDGKPLDPAIQGKVSDILCDRQGRIWISLFTGGLEMLSNGESGRLQHRSFFEGSHAIAQPRQMIQDDKGYIWLCSNEGIYRFLPDALIKNDSAYQHLNVSGANSSSDEIHCIYEDSRHRIWVGTSGYGLFCLDHNGHVTQQFTTKDGLPNNNIQSIIDDANGHLWVGTDYGLGRYVEKEQRFQAYYLSNTPQGMMFTEGCTARLNDGRLAMGTLHGLLAFDPAYIKPQTSTFPLILTNIRINGVSLMEMGDDSPADKALDMMDELRFSHDQNSLTFYFSVFEYNSHQAARYACLLEGFDEDWSEPSTLNFATYKNLPPGNYTLHVRSYSANGIQNDHEVSLRIVIRQPWYNTWWAWIFYIFFLGAITWAIWRQWHHNEELRTKIKVENQLTEYKLRFFTNISHEFRTPFTIIRGAMDRITQQGDIPGKLKQPISSMQKSTDRMLRLINELLEFRKIQNHQLRLQVEQTDIVDFLRTIFLTFNETAENHHINYQFLTFAREYQLFIDRNFVDKMAYNLLSNAFKYTPDRREIIMRVALEGDVLSFSVEDTGIGVKKEKQGDLFSRYNQSAFSRDSIGIGLHMVSELVRVHHGTISFRENPEGGSIFTVTLPTDKSVYSEADFLVTDNNELLQKPSDIDQQAAVVSYKEMELPPMNDREVLVVDDDDDMLAYVSGELRRYFNIRTATNGEEALQKIQIQRPDLVVSDVRMPVMDGFELTRRIRQDQALNDLPVILLTAMTDEKKQVRGAESGADDYLLKPFNARVLVAKCSSLLAQRSRLRQKYAKEVVDKEPLADIIVEDVDKKFLERFDTWVYSHLEEPDMNFMDFANSMKMGRTNFFKKVKQLTGVPPHEYIRKARLTRAAELLKDPSLSVSEVSYQCGFDDPNYFSRCFKDYFGVTASQFRKGKVDTEKTTAS